MPVNFLFLSFLKINDLFSSSSVPAEEVEVWSSLDFRFIVAASFAVFCGPPLHRLDVVSTPNDSSDGTPPRLLSEHLSP